MSLRSRTYFELSRLPLKDIIIIIYEWSRDTSIKEVEYQYGFANNTVIDHYRFCRDPVVEKYRRDMDSHCLGGVNIVVEIDEALVSRRKYNRGRLVKEVWVFGAIERQADNDTARKRMIVEVVEDRKKDTLREVIIRRIRTGTTIYSDSWAGYGDLNEIGYIHQMVNHSENFVNPNDKNVHTQTIESSWQKLKSSLKKKELISKFILRNTLQSTCLKE